MIYPRLEKVQDGQPLSIELLNGLIKRTEHAADLLEKYKIINSVEASNAKGKKIILNRIIETIIRYRILTHTPTLELVNGGPSIARGTITLQRHRGIGTISDPIIPLPWETPSNGAIRISILFGFPSKIIPVTGAINTYSIESTDLASQTGAQQAYTFLYVKSVLKAALLVPFPYTRSPVLFLSGDLPRFQTNARMTVSYLAGPIIDYYPVEMTLLLNGTNEGNVTERFIVEPPVNLFSQGSYTTNATYNTTEQGLVGIDERIPRFVFGSTYFGQFFATIMPS